MRLLKSSRTHLLLLAASIFIISSILGLSAYITDKTYYTGTFHTAAGEELGFSITGKTFEDSLVIPGNTVTIEAKAEVTGPVPLYVFVELDIPMDFTISDLNSSWKPIKTDSNIYYFGTNTDLMVLGPGATSSTIFNKIVLSKNAKGGESYSMKITGYAIQADNIAADTDPATVFGMIEKPVTPTTEPEGGSEG